MLKTIYISGQRLYLSSLSRILSSTIEFRTYLLALRGDSGGDDFFDFADYSVKSVIGECQVSSLLLRTSGIMRSFLLLLFFFYH